MVRRIGRERHGQQKNIFGGTSGAHKSRKKNNEALKKLEEEGKIDTNKIPKNSLDETQSFKRIESIIKEKQGSKTAYKIDKKGVKDLDPKPSLSKRKLAPDFKDTPYLYNATGEERAIVKMKMTGNRDWDDLLAYELSGIKNSDEISKMYTWHHLDDFDPVKGTCTMQLVDFNVHSKNCIPHIGSASLFDDYFNFGHYNKSYKIK